MKASVILALIETAKFILREVRKALSDPPPDLDVAATKDSLAELDAEMAYVKTERARLIQELERDR